MPTTSRPDTEPPHAPAPINANPGEPLAHTRTRALMIAEHHGLIGKYIGPIDAATTDPTRLRYAYLPKGDSLSKLARRIRRGPDGHVGLPYLEASEVLPYCYGLAVAVAADQRSSAADAAIIAEFQSLHAQLDELPVDDATRAALDEAVTALENRAADMLNAMKPRTGPLGNRLEYRDGLS